MATGGTASGGVATGGAASGGMATGGTASGGMGTGGQTPGSGGAGTGGIWMSLGGVATSGPAVVRDTYSPVFDVFALGSEPNALVQHAMVSGVVVSAWDSLPGAPPAQPIGQPAAAVHNGRTELIVLAGKTIYYSYNEPGHPWGFWIPVGDGNLTAGVSACAFLNDRLDVFGRGPAPDYLLWHSEVNVTAPSGVWDSNAGGPPGGLRGAPTALSRLPGSFDVVGQSDADGRLYHCHYDGITYFSSWTALGELSDTITVQASLSSVDADRLDIWARGSDGRLRHTSFAGDVPPSGSTLTWTTPLIDSPDLVLPPALGLQVIPALDRQLNLFARSAAGSDIVRVFVPPGS